MRLAAGGAGDRAGVSLTDRSPASFRDPAEAPSLLSRPYPLTASQHRALLHRRFPGGAVGHVVVATKSPGEGWHEEAYATGELAEGLQYDQDQQYHDQDTYRQAHYSAHVFTSSSYPVRRRIG